MATFIVPRSQHDQVLSCAAVTSAIQHAKDIFPALADKIDAIKFSFIEERNGRIGSLGLAWPDQSRIALRRSMLENSGLGHSSTADRLAYDVTLHELAHVIAYLMFRKNEAHGFFWGYCCIHLGLNPDKEMAASH